MQIVVAAHGTSIQGPEPPAVNVLENLPDTSWTDVIGLRQGQGATFRGKGGHDGWFHLPLPAPSTLFDAQVAVVWVEVEFAIEGEAHADALHVWNSTERVAALDGQNARSALRVDVPEFRFVDAGINASIHVVFRESANIAFRGGRVALVPVARPVR